MSDEKTAEGRNKPNEQPASEAPRRPLNESLLGINRLRPDPLGDDGRQGSLDGVTMLRPTPPPTNHTPATPPITPSGAPATITPPVSQGDT